MTSSLARRRILITGAGGLVGSALQRELRLEGCDDIAAVTSSDVDLTDWASTRALIERVRPEIVFHVAARVYGLMGNLENLERVFTDNIRMNTNVVEGAHLVGAQKVVAMGSAAIYSDTIPLPMQEQNVWDGPPHSSEAPYAHAKRAMLAQLETYNELSGMDFAFCVSTNLFGPNDRFDERWGHVIPSLISKFYSAVTQGVTPVVWGTGTPTRDLLYSYDAARAIRLIAEDGHGVVNLATGVSHTIRTIVETLQEVSGYQGEVAWDTSKPDGQMQRAYDVSRLAALGFTPRWSLADGLRDTFEWYSANVENARR